MAEFLSPEQLIELTGKKQGAAQRRELQHMGIAFLSRTDGSLVVQWRDVETKRREAPKLREPKLNLEPVKPRLVPKRVRA